MVVACPDEDAEGIRGSFLKYFWTNFVRNELDWGSRDHTQKEFSHAVAVMDTIGGWEKREEDKNRIGARFGACIWIYNHSRTFAAATAIIKTSEVLCGAHEWLQQYSMERQECEIMKS